MHLVLIKTEPQVCKTFLLGIIEFMAMVFVIVNKIG